MNVINVNNVRGNFFGGMPFDVNWSFNGGDSPSKLTISVVNERGEYADPQSSLGYGRPQDVRIGGFKFKGYLTSYQFKNSPDKKILELSYSDQSVNLDRYYVGLQNKWGDKNGSNPPRLIIVGKAYHPCDQDLNSTVEYEEIEGQVDPCDPCPEMPPDKYENACDPVLSEFNIFEVYYTFNELISAISNDFNCSFDASDYFSYKSNHIGPLREVLNRWCSDLGLAFFWDPFLSELKFISRKNKINIPSQSTLESDNNLIDLEYGGTVEDTYTQGSIGYFSREGNVENYTCEQSTLENLNCLTLGALAEDGTFNSGGGEGGSGGEGSNLKDFEAKELAVALSYYSLEMRDAILWFYYYDILDPSKLNEFVQEKTSSGQGASSGKLPAKILSFFGNMEVLKVLSSDSENSDDRADFTRLSDLLSREQRSALNLGLNGPTTRGSDDNPNYYFFIAKANEDLYNKERDREAELARNFLGRFWVKDYETTIPNASNSRTEVTIESPDGNGGWYYKNSQLKNLSIFDFGHEEGSFISTLDDEASDSEDEYDTKLDTYSNSPEEKEFTVKGFILHEREPKWEPEQDFAKWYKDLFDWYANQIPTKFAQGDGRPEILFNIYPDAISDPQIRLYMVRKGNADAYKIKFDIKNSTEHPKESRRKPVKNEIEHDIFGEIEINEICNYGLGENAKYVMLTIGEEAIIIHSPVESFSRTTQFDPSSASKTTRDKILYGDKAPEGSSTGYDVIATAKSDFKIYFPKIEYVKQYNAEDIRQASKVIYHYEQIDEDNLNIFRKNRGSKNSSRADCQVDKKAIEEYMEKANKFTRYSMTQVQNKASFRSAGAFSSSYGVEDGLSIVSISVTDNGVFTDYVLEDKIISPPSIDILKQNLRNFIPIKQAKNRGSISPINKTNLRKYEKAVRNV